MIERLHLKNTKIAETILVIVIQKYHRRWGTLFSQYGFADNNKELKISCIIKDSNVN